MTDISKDLAGDYIAASSLGEDVYQGIVAEVVRGQYQKWVLEFEDGKKRGLSKSNLKDMARAYGAETNAWVGKEVKLVVGELKVGGELKPSIMLTPVSPVSKAQTAKRGAQRPLKVDEDRAFDDEGLEIR